MISTRPCDICNNINLIRAQINSINADISRRELEAQSAIKKYDAVSDGDPRKEVYQKIAALRSRIVVDLKSERDRIVRALDDLDTKDKIYHAEPTAMLTVAVLRDMKANKK